MKIKSVFLALLSVGILFLCGCEARRESQSSSSSDDSDSAETSVVETLDSEGTHEIQDMSLTLKSYDLSVEAVSAQGIIKIKQVVLPESINGYKPAIFYLLSKESALVMLFGDDELTYRAIREVGILNIWSGDYETVYVPEENYVLGAHYADNEVVVLSTSSNGFQEDSISLLYIDDGHCEKLYDRSIDPETNQPFENWNNICRVRENIFFDDIFTGGDGEVYVDLFSYDIYEHTVELVKENAQNAMPYGDSVLAITQDAEGIYTVLTVLPDEKLMDIQVDLLELVSEGGDVFCIENVHTDHEKHYTTRGLKDLTTGETILTTNYAVSNTIGSLSVSDSFVCFDNTIPEYPCIYDIKHSRLLVIDELPKAYSTFILKSYYGVFASNISQNDEVVTSYYYFQAS